MPVTPVSKVSPARFAALDFLRFAAAVSVVGYHLSAYKKDYWGGTPVELFPLLTPFTKYGALGVELFFVISGFVILLSVHGRSLSQYTSSRIARIFPAYWVAVILGAILFMFLWPEGKEVGFGQVLANLTMTQSASGAAHVDGVFWTLWVELRFYVLIGVLAVWGITPIRILLVCSIWPVLGLLANQSDSAFIGQLLIGSEAPLFAGGMMIYFIYKYGWSYLSGLVLLMNVFLSANQVTGWLRNAMENNTGQHINPTYLSLAVLLIFGIVALSVLSPLRNISLRWMTWLGLLTYPLYLVHEAWGWYVIMKLAPVLSPAQTLLVTLSVVTVMAIALHYAVEKPFGRSFRKRLENEFERLSRLNPKLSKAAEVVPSEQETRGS